MTEKNSIWFLKSILSQFEDSSNYFKDYLTTNNKKTWDLYSIKSLGWISYAQIIDRKLMPSSYFKKLEDLIDYAETQYRYSDYSNNPDPKDIIETLKVLEILKVETKKLLALEEKRLKILDPVDKLLKEAS